MKVLFVTGCPRSGTTFYSMKIFQDVTGFYVDYYNYEPAILHDAQYAYMQNKDDGFQQLERTFVDYISKQNIKKEDWIVIKHPYFSFILPELYSFNFQKKILLIDRNVEDVLNSRINFKDSLSQVETSYKCTWPYFYGVHDREEEWENGDYKKRMQIYVQVQKEIELKNLACCIQVDYGQDLVNNSDFVRELDLNDEQIIKLNKNFVNLWKDKNYHNNREANYQEAAAYKIQKNMV